jgi:hypothetical protein
MARMRDQQQFLNVLDRDEAERRFRAAIDAAPRGIEQVVLDAALGRVLAANVRSPVDVPSFDRSNVDGFAVIAEDTFGALEEAPRGCSCDCRSSWSRRCDCDRGHDAARRRRSRHGGTRRRDRQ